MQPGVVQGERYAGFESRGWRPSCQCGAATIPALVLDPFVGTGTTVVEANRLGRRAVGVELSPDFVKIASRRTAQGALFGANSVSSVNLMEKLPMLLSRVSVVMLIILGLSGWSAVSAVGQNTPWPANTWHALTALGGAQETNLVPSGDDEITVYSPRCRDGSFAEFRAKIDRQHPDRSSSIRFLCQGREIEPSPPTWHFLYPQKGDKPWGDGQD
jgi:hypothetical protein